MTHLHVHLQWFLLLSYHQRQKQQQQLSSQQRELQLLLDYRQLRQHLQSRQLVTLLLEVRNISWNAKTPKIFKRQSSIWSWFFIKQTAEIIFLSKYFLQVIEPLNWICDVFFGYFINFLNGFNFILLIFCSLLHWYIIQSIL